MKQKASPGSLTCPASRHCLHQRTARVRPAERLGKYSRFTAARAWVTLSAPTSSPSAALRRGTTYVPVAAAVCQGPATGFLVQHGSPPHDCKESHQVEL